MNTIDDVFGAAAKDYFESNDNALQITTKSSLGDVDCIPMSYFFRPFEQMNDLEQKALQLSVSPVLDVGCGVGNHMLYLQEQQIKVVGLDSSEGCVEIALQRGAREVYCDLWQNLKADTTYQTILLMMNGLGLAGRLNELSSFLLKLVEQLDKDGFILADSVDLRYLFENEGEAGFWVPADQAYYGDLTYTTTYKDLTTSFEWLFVGFELLRDICNSIGLKCEKVLELENYHYLARISRL